MPITPVDYQPLPYVRSGNLGTLIGLRGQHQSEALLRAGEIQAKLWSDLGQNIAQGVTSYAKQQQEAPQKAMTLKLDQARLNDEQAQADQRTAGAAEKSAFDTALKGAMRTDPDTGLVTYDRNKAQQLLVSANMGHLAPQINEILDKSDAADQALAKSHQDAIRASADLVDRLGNDPTLFAHEIQRGIQNKRYTEQDVAPYLEAAQTDPSNVAKITASILGKKPDLMAVPAGESVIDKNNPKAAPVYTAPAKDTTKYESKGVTLNGKPNQLVGFDPTTNTYWKDGTDVTAQVQDKPPASTLTNPEALNDVKETVAGMKDGSLPPMMPGRATKEYLATMAEAHRQGYDLQAAVTDWNATQKHIATLNGQQQTRLNQSINALPDLLDTVDALASKWKGGKFPILNKANLALAKNGVYGDDVATVARQLDSQIADVTADLGNVYMGGNSPTDQALSLASKSLGGEWSEKVLHDMVALARKNVTIRQNSIKNTGVQGASANNPYAPPVQPAAAPAAPQAPAGWKYVAKPGGGWTAVQDK